MKLLPFAFAVTLTVSVVSLAFAQHQSNKVRAHPYGSSGGGGMAAPAAPGGGGGGGSDLTKAKIHGRALAAEERVKQYYKKCPQAEALEKQRLNRTRSAVDLVKALGLSHKLKSHSDDPDGGGSAARRAVPRVNHSTGDGGGDGGPSRRRAPARHGNH